MRTRPVLILALLLAFSGLAAAQKFHTSLPVVARSGAAQAARDSRIEKYRQQYLRVARAGKLGVITPAKAKEEAKLAAMAGDIAKGLRTSKDDRPILVIIEGPDGAGKSSTIRRLEKAFEGAREVSQVHFGAPPANAEDVHWTKRYYEALPAKGSVAFWDRSYYGRAVYDPYYGLANKQSTKATLQEISHLEGMLAGKVRIVKFYLDTPGKKLAKTIAKREVTAPDKLGESDYLTYRDRKDIANRFQHAMDKTGDAVPWHVIDMSDRGGGREQMLNILAKELGD